MSFNQVIANFAGKNADGNVIRATDYNMFPVFRRRASLNPNTPRENVICKISAVVINIHPINT